MSFPIADLHCDLLSYLASNPERTPYDEKVRCSIPQLQEGNVKLQVLAVFSETHTDSVKRGARQLEIYQQLPLLYPAEIANPNDQNDKSLQTSNKIKFVIAFENASAFCDELESIQDGIKRLRTIIQTIAKPVYISLTWNGENRFGGGIHSDGGLKEDGKHLLHEMHEQNIALDFSHTSDRLAHDILNYMEQEELDIPVIASHSNSRAVTNVPRNLSDEIAKEIFRRNGIIGLNFYRFFVGLDAETDFVKHIEHWIKLGGPKQICFGADFFYKEDLPAFYHPHIDEEPFHLDYGNASCYGKLLALFQKKLKLSQEDLEGLAHRNVLEFFNHSQIANFAA